MRAGATILVTITNDAWYGDTAAPWQHYAAARFRAAENRRPLLRAAITGVSAIVAADGSERARLDPFRRGVIRGRVAGRRALSPYSRTPWLVPLLSTLLAAALLALAWRALAPPTAALRERLERRREASGAAPCYRLCYDFPSRHPCGPRPRVRPDSRAPDARKRAPSWPPKHSSESRTCPSAWSPSGGIFEGARFEDELAELDKQMQRPGFWDDPQANAPVVRRRKSLERRLETLNQLRSDAEDLEAWQELLAEGETDPEVQAFLDRLDRDLQRLDLELKLSGPDDDKNAIVSVHPGAGGTESQDWAEMLLRMYLRWAEKDGYEVEMLDRLDGDEAGIKSATFAVRGELRLRLPEGRERRPPAGAHQPLRLAESPPHLLRLGRRLPRDRRRHRDRDRGQGPAHRHLPRLRRRRPARQQDGVGGAHHPPARPASWCPARTSAARSRTARRR